MDKASEFDVIVVGTGPGGATVARDMALKNKTVLMLEWGNDQPIKGSMPQFAKAVAIPGKSVLVTQDLCGMLRGITTGGSSVFYYGAAFEPPYEMFDAYGIDIRREIEEIKAQVPVRPLPDQLIGPLAKRIMESARSLGLNWQKLNKFIYAEKCRPDCFRCTYGCPENAKWNARMFVDEALRKGARLINNARVMQVLSENGKAIGVTCRRKRKLHRAYAQTIIISAGGIGSPVILRQSGIKEAGYDFFFDPLIVVMGTVYDLKGGRGEIPMACGMHVEEDGYIMTDMAVPLTLHMAFNAEMGRFGQMHKHKRTLQIMVKIKDRLGGALTDKGGVRKRMTEFDKVKIYKGYARAREILARAGAKNIHRSWYLAAHPGGTVKVNDLVNSDLKTEIDNLYVCDCSVIPESWGRPPVLTLLALGRRLAKHLTGELVAGKVKQPVQEPPAN